MENKKNALLVAEKLSAGYKHIILFSNINFQLYAGQIVAILGINGSGKTSLLKTCCGLLNPMAGKITLQNKLINEYAPSDLAKEISVVLTGSREITQNLSAYELFKISRSAATDYLHRFAATDKKKIDEVTDLFYLNAIAYRKLYTLSDGEFQKVMIARAVVQDTPLIFLDEPTSHLDIFNKIEIFRLMKNLAKEYNKTIVFATHELELAMQIADACILLNKQHAFLFDTTAHLIDTGKIELFFETDFVTFNRTDKKFDFKL